jgi:hypothetical protein
MTRDIHTLMLWIQIVAIIASVCATSTLGVLDRRGRSDVNCGVDTVANHIYGSAVVPLKKGKDAP